MSDNAKEITAELNAKEKRLKLCLISSSGGHFEQLCMLKKLSDKHDIFMVTEKTKYGGNADYCTCDEYPYIDFLAHSRISPFLNLMQIYVLTA